MMPAASAVTILTIINLTVDAPVAIIIPVEFEKTPGSPSVPTIPSDPSVAGFTDVKASDYFAQPVAWAVEKGVTAGVGNNQFGPSQICSRGQIVSFLYRAFTK